MSISNPSMEVSSQNPPKTVKEALLHCTIENKYKVEKISNAVTMTFGESTTAISNEQRVKLLKQRLNNYSMCAYDCFIGPSFDSFISTEKADYIVFGLTDQTKLLIVKKEMTFFDLCSILKNWICEFLAYIGFLCKFFALRKIS